jgi:hypothetical protein
MQLPMKCILLRQKAIDRAHSTPAQRDSSQRHSGALPRCWKDPSSCPFPDRNEPRTFSPHYSALLLSKVGSSPIALLLRSSSCVYTALTGLLHRRHTLMLL